MSAEVWFDASWDVRMTDTSLRDGSHHKRHQFTLDEVGAIVAALDGAGVPVIMCSAAGSILGRTNT